MVEPGILDNQRLARFDNMLAERMCKRRFARGLPRIGNPNAAQEKLPVGIEQCDERDGRRYDAPGQTRVAVEVLIGSGVQQR